jgi:hypothetical protein
MEIDKRLQIFSPLLHFLLQQEIQEKIQTPLKCELFSRGHFLSVGTNKVRFFANFL